MAPPYDRPFHALFPPLARMRELISMLPEGDAEHFSTLRQLILGPTLSALLLRDGLPGVDAIADLLRVLRARRDLFPIVEDLALEVNTGADAVVELAVDDLLAADFAWEHPTEVLERNERPPYDKLFAACERRLESREHDAAHMAVLEKVRRALRIDREAAERRQRLRRN